MEAGPVRCLENIIEANSILPCPPTQRWESTCTHTVCVGGHSISQRRFPSSFYRWANWDLDGLPERLTMGRAWIDSLVFPTLPALLWGPGSGSPHPALSTPTLALLDSDARVLHKISRDKNISALKRFKNHYTLSWYLYSTVHLKLNYIMC